MTRALAPEDSFFVSFGMDALSSGELSQRRVEARWRMSKQRKLLIAIFLFALCAMFVGWAPFLQQSALRIPLVLLFVFAVWALLGVSLLMYLRRGINSLRRRDQ
jgi:CHASE2 domain-containing sensor protein